MRMGRTRTLCGERARRPLIRGKHFEARGQPDVRRADVREPSLVEDGRVRAAAQGPQLAEYAGPLLVHGVRDLHHEQISTHASTNEGPLMRFHPSTCTSLQMPGAARYPSAKVAMNVASEMRSVPGTAFTGRAVWLGAEARKWREHDAVGECVRTDNGRLEERWDDWCGHGVARFVLGAV